jgi:hypothetical protein
MTPPAGEHAYRWPRRWAFAITVMAIIVVVIAVLRLA